MSKHCDAVWGSEDSTGPFRIDYAYLYDCSSDMAHPLLILVYFFWIIYLISLLAQTASNYLSPTLSKICEKLHVAYDVAGVTFLAFGNGAPDFFSLIASFSGGVDILVGVGALLGGSMFVCTVVVGSIAILSPCDVSQRIFLRDVSFHFLAITLVVTVAAVRHIYLSMVFLLLAVYVVYVGVVVVNSQRYHVSTMGDDNGAGATELRPMTVENMEVQTAFWHVDSTVAAKDSQSVNRGALTNSQNIPGRKKWPAPSSSSSSSLSTSPSPSAASSLTGAGSGGYSFVMMDKEAARRQRKARRKAEKQQQKQLSTRRAWASTYHSLDSTRGEQQQQSSSDDSDDDQDDNNSTGDGQAAASHASDLDRRTLNLSGGFELDVERIVQEEYFSPPPVLPTRTSSAPTQQLQQQQLLLQQQMQQVRAPRIRVGEESEGGIQAVLSPHSRSRSRSSHHSSPRGGAASGVFIIDGDDDADDEEEGNPMMATRSVSPGRNANLGVSLLSASYQHTDNMDFDEDVDAPPSSSANSASAMAFMSSGSRMWQNSTEYSALQNWKLARYSAPVLTAMYWQQWTLRRSLRHRLQDDWAQAQTPWQRAWVVLEGPATLLRDLTIPTLEHDQWSKTVALCHPVVAPLFVLFVLDMGNSLTPGDVFLLLCFMGASCLMIFLGTQHSRPPLSNRAFVTVWTLGAFVMCVFWIYALAGELITILSVLGEILSLPPAFLGLTVLAWGNSVGDLFTNTAVAQQGLGTMALAGCYGGPVFNVLVGFGSSLLFATSQVYPRAFTVALDASCWVSLGFLLWTLASTIAIVSLRGYKVDRAFGFYLLSVYLVYSLVQAVLVLAQR